MFLRTVIICSTFKRGLSASALHVANHRHEVWPIFSTSMAWTVGWASAGQEFQASIAEEVDEHVVQIT